VPVFLPITGLPAELKKTDVQMNSKRILLVDDIELNRVIILEMLRAWKHDLITACNGEEAVRLTRSQQFDLILMDIQMPVMNGVEATRIIRADLSNLNCRTPIIAISANAGETDKITYMQAGMNQVLAKPFTSAALFQVMTENLQITLTEIPIRQEPEQLTGSYRHVGFDFTYLLRIGKDSRAFVGMMLQSFRDSAIDISGEMEQAMGRADWTTISQLVHKIKFALNVVGAVSLDEEVKWLEANTRQPHPETVPEIQVRTDAFINEIKELYQEACVLIDSGEWR
jgi:two-component system, sensor histidine kinase